MNIRVPQNQIVLNKYTAGNEYMYNDNYNEYIERRVIEKKIENNGSINRRKKIL